MNNILNQSQFAASLGISQPYISRLVSEGKISTTADNKINEITGFLEFMAIKALTADNNVQMEYLKALKSIENLKNAYINSVSSLKDENGNNLNIPMEILAAFSSASNQR